MSEDVKLPSMPEWKDRVLTEREDELSTEDSDDLAFWLAERERQLLEALRENAELECRLDQYATPYIG